MSAMRVSEVQTGEGVNAALVSLMLGTKDGPVGLAFALALARPRPGFGNVLATLRPQVPCKPPTLFVSRVEMRDVAYHRMVMGPAQIGVARGLQEAINQGHLPPMAPEGWVGIATVAVDPGADDADLLYRNHLVAARESIVRALRSGFDHAALSEAAAGPFNDYYVPPVSP
ncbi:formaldehyde-activating enzyme [Zavarzinia sp. CC-PAN008]|uniref:formaldehyde-activating enzyme n=1 Tax=Zavarzinia sp. CC-PAN008 TaxID=3243332 RepID=UPI003F747317